MKTTNNTILITGGSAGIGFETAKLLSENGNNVIIIGRDENRLATAASKLKGVSAIKADISSADDLTNLVATLKNDFPLLNVVINNAGKAEMHDLADQSKDSAAIAEDEMLTNYLSVIKLNQLLIPLLKQQAEAAIVNVSSVVAFAPGTTLPTYAASKAALHSYTTSLRLSLAHTSIKVFELMPPLVDTELSAAIGGQHGIKPSQVATEFFEAFTNDKFEIHVGDTAKIYELFLSSPADALSVMNANRQAWIEPVS